MNEPICPYYITVRPRSLEPFYVVRDATKRGGVKVGPLRKELFCGFPEFLYKMGQDFFDI